MKPVRIAHISYLNSAPFFAGMQDDRIEMVDMHPRALGEAAARGEIDAGLMSIADTFRNTDFEPLGDLGISLDGPAHSVLLFSARPVRELEGSSIGITGETSTSYPLLRLLLDGCFAVHPASYVRRPQGADRNDAGLLLIGDAALQRAARSGLEPGRRDYCGGVLELGTSSFDEPYQHVLDLSAAWKKWQERPFVFARWMVRNDVPHDARIMLVEALLASLDANMRRLEEVSASYADQAGISAAAAYAYLMCFNYRFGEAGNESVKLFRDLLEATMWWESAPPTVLQGEGA